MLKEIKERIHSVKNTRKITSAMKMVSAAKLNKAQRNIAGMRPYSLALNHILRCVVAAVEGDFDTPLARQRPPERVAIVAFSSDSSLAGSFNSNVVKELRKTMDTYAHLPKENRHLYTVGKKIFEAAKKSGYPVARHFDGLAAHPDYDMMAVFAEELISQFQAKALDCVEVIYHQFKSAGMQKLMHEKFLPIALSVHEKTTTGAAQRTPDYIFEPSGQAVLTDLLPKSLKLRLYTTLLDSSASEHAARVMAMQIATDNADELIGDLTVEYNKSRQQAITNELLDIIGGSLK
jgi:F-type H+-transporting ATPase subunit gamma